MVTGELKVKANQNFCRLCGGTLSNRFSRTILQKYNVQYYECNECHSLQTEKPYWLDEAYTKNLSNLDTGAAQRTLNNLAACYTVSKIFSVKNAIDIGGGDGLLCRLLRDYDINCFVKDKYAKSTYAQGFTEPDFKTPDLVVAFEVLEHYPNPQADLNDIFGYNSNFVLVSTLIYANDREDWWYLSPESGQHVFFYSKNALDLIATKYNYNLTISGGFILFVKKEIVSPLKTLLVKILLKSRICRIIKSFVVLLPTQSGVWKDHLSQKEKSKPNQQKR